VNLRTLALRILLGSVVVCAVLGIVLILGGRLSDLALKIMATTFAVSSMSLLGLGSFAGWNADGGRLFARVGVVSSIATAIMIFVEIWLGWNSMFAVQLELTFLILAFTGAHNALASLTKLAPQHQWIRPTVHAITTLLAASLLAAVWDIGVSAGLAKLIGVLTVLDAASTITIVVFHVLDRVAPPPGNVAEVCYCPRCGKRLWVPAGEVRCHHCDERFFIELRPKGDLPDAIITEAPK
jgi:hypothetical protein